MGDFLRNDMFDKYFMKIGAQDKTPATGYDSAHYLMAGILHGVVELVHPGHGRSDAATHTSDIRTHSRDG